MGAGTDTICRACILPARLISVPGTMVVLAWVAGVAGFGGCFCALWGRMESAPAAMPSSTIDAASAIPFPLIGGVFIVPDILQKPCRGRYDQPASRLHH